MNIVTKTFFHTGSAVQSAKHELMNVKISQNRRMTKLVHKQIFAVNIDPISILKMIRTPQMIESKYDPATLFFKTRQKSHFRFEIFGCEYAIFSRGGGIFPKGILYL